MSNKQELEGQYEITTKLQAKCAGLIAEKADKARKYEAQATSNMVIIKELQVLQLISSLL